MALLSQMKKNWKLILFIICVIAIALLAFWWLKISTPYGLGLINDSYAYVGGAVHMLDGHGYSRLSGRGEVTPITHFPPMFSIILALIGLTGFEIIRAARLVILALYGFNAILVAISLLIITRNYLISLSGALFFATSSIFLRVHSLLMSEPLYIMFSLASGLFFALFFHEKHRRWLFFAGLFTGFAALTRYAGMALFFTTIIAIIILRHKLKDISLDLASFLSGGLPILLAWSLRNRLLTGTTANRKLLWHPPAWSKIEAGLLNFWDWLLPERIFTVFKEQKWIAYSFTVLIIIALLTMVISVCYRFFFEKGAKKNAEKGDALFLFHQIYIFIYLGSILATMTFFDASTLFENRILAPMEVSFLIVLLALIAKWVEKRPYIIKLVVALSLLVFAWFWVREGRQTVSILRKDGQGFASLSWRNSQTIEYIRRLPSDKIIYTNKSTGVFLLTGRNAYAVQSRVDPVTQIPRANYAADLERLHNDVKSRQAVLIFFGADQQIEPEDRAWLKDLTSGLSIFENFGDSEVYDR